MSNALLAIEVVCTKRMLAQGEILEYPWYYSGYTKIVNAFSMCSNFDKPERAGISCVFFGHPIERIHTVYLS